MSPQIYERNREQRRETYLLASKNPWLVWRLKAFHAGYVPPLIVGRIPADLAHTQIRTQRSEYKIDPLIQHADRVKREERTFLKRTLTWLILVTMLLLGLGFTMASKRDSSFRIGILEATAPRVQTLSSIHAE